MVAIKLGLGLYPGQMLMMIFFFFGGKGLCLDGKYPEGRCLG